MKGSDKMKDEYEQQAQTFLKSTGATIEVKFKKHGLHFEDDKDERDIYKVTIKKGNRGYAFDFGQSINNSGEYKSMITQHHTEDKYKKYGVFKGQNLTTEEFKYYNRYYKLGYGGFEKNKKFKVPTAYDILSCLNVFDGNFKDFCSDFGYDEDSIKANNIFKNVEKESNNLKMLFNDTELEQLAEIQ